MLKKLLLIFALLFKNPLVNQQPIAGGKKLLLPLDLQLFAGEGDPPPNDPPGDPKPPAGDPPPVDPPQDPPKTFTQEELNNIAAKEAKKAQEKLLKQLGIEDFNNAKDGLQKFKEWQDSQKTDQQKQADRLKELETNFSSTSDENSMLKAQISAMKVGVLAESVEDVVVLAKMMVNDETDMDAAIVKVVEKYPHFKEQKVPDAKPPETKPSFSTGQHQKPQESDVDKWLAAFK